ncbi:MAG: hypothetical protein ACRC62_15555 [Microcoleus sp.]
MEGQREYFDLDLKNQGKARMAIAHAALKELGGIIHDTYESKYFKGKQSWRNPLLMRISLPDRMRWEFIRRSRLWLARPPVYGAPEMVFRDPILDRPLPLVGNHKSWELPKVRNYRLHPTPSVRTLMPDGSYLTLDGAEALIRVLDGDLDFSRSFL